jgi:hypothetical protein
MAESYTRLMAGSSGPAPRAFAAFGRVQCNTVPMTEFRIDFKPCIPVGGSFPLQ